MTDLEGSPVTRRTTAKFRDRRIIVTLNSDDTIELRLERLQQKSVKIPIANLMLGLTQYFGGAGGPTISVPAGRLTQAVSGDK